MIEKTKLLAGLASGLTGGLVFGMMMAKMGTLPMIGKMIGLPTAAAGWFVHLGISATIGVSFSILLGWLITGRTSSLAIGTIYGTAWWFLGPLTLMPLFMGMGFGVNWNLTAAQNMLPSLLGHMVFGVAMGFTYDLVLRQLVQRRLTADPTHQEAEAAV